VTELHEALELWVEALAAAQARTEEAELFATEPFFPPDR
jgi:hypothetical protein